MRKPKVIARIVVSTAPTTEAKPFTAQPHATYSRGWSVSGEPRRGRAA